MNEIMNKLFEQYNFVKTWEEDNRMFYVNTDKNIISSDCRQSSLTGRSFSCVMTAKIMYLQAYKK